MTTTLIMPFRSLAEWRQWNEQTPGQHRADVINSLANQIRTSGLLEPITNRRFGPAEITIRGDNYRESVRAGLLISRQRAVCLALQKLSAGDSPRLDRKIRIYATEALTDFALFFRGIFPRFLGSEYAPTPAEQSAIFPALHRDLLALDFADSCFDYVISNDVLEHVPDIDRSLAECCRVLTPGGGLVATFPFAHNSDTGIRKAAIANGQVIHLTDPEYHGNPMRPDEGSLVFQIPGWDVLRQAKAAGFQDAFFMYASSIEHGVIGAGISGVFVFIAKK